MEQRPTPGLLRTLRIFRNGRSPEQSSSRSIPDFSNELDQFEEIVNSYESSTAWDKKCDDLIDHVAGKLQLWNPEMATRFKRASYFESDYMLLEYRKLMEFRARYSNLQRIVFPEESAWLRFSMLFRM